MHALGDLNVANKTKQIKTNFYWYIFRLEHQFDFFLLNHIYTPYHNNFQ